MGAGSIGTVCRRLANELALFFAACWHVVGCMHRLFCRSIYAEMCYVGNTHHYFFFLFLLSQARSLGMFFWHGSRVLIEDGSSSCLRLHSIQDLVWFRSPSAQQRPTIPTSHNGRSSAHGAAAKIMLHLKHFECTQRSHAILTSPP